MRTLLILFATSVLVACSYSLPPAVEPARDRSAELYKCMDEVDLSAFKNSQWNECLGAELRRAEARLQVAQSKLETSLSNPAQALPDQDPESHAKFLVAQISWRKFHDDYCEYEAGSGEAPNPEYNRLDCLIDLTKEQVKRLEGAP